MVMVEVDDVVVVKTIAEFCQGTAGRTSFCGVKNSMLLSMPEEQMKWKMDNLLTPGLEIEPTTWHTMGTRK
jgi:hypothetical protein